MKIYAYKNIGNSILRFKLEKGIYKDEHVDYVGEIKVSVKKDKIKIIKKKKV